MQPSPAPVSAREWSIRDFVVIVLAGFAGGIVGAIAVGVSGDIGVALVAGLASQYGGNLIAMAVLLNRKGLSWSDLGLELRGSDGWFLFLGIGLQIALVLLFAPLAILLGQEGSAQAVGEVIPEADGLAVRILLVLGIALLAPVTEELMFRGVLMQSLERRGSARSALLWSTLVFAAFHLIGLTTENFFAAAVLAMPQLFIVGLVLGRLTQRRRRLGPAIMIHAGYNLIAVLALLVAFEMPV